MTTICAGPERVFFGVGPPAVPSRINREEIERGNPDVPASGAAPRSARKSRRFTPALYLVACFSEDEGLARFFRATSFAFGSSGRGLGFGGWRPGLTMEEFAGWIGARRRADHVS